MKKSSHSTFCTIPWIQTMVGETGAFHSCCISSPIREDALLKADGTPYRINEESGPFLATNSEFLKSLRLQMLNNKRPAQCSNCFFFEDEGYSSNRLRMNNKFKEIIPELINKTSKDGTIPAESKQYLHLRLGNFCNLKCRMCDSVSSSNLKNELDAILPQLQSSPGLSSKDHQNEWYKEPESWREVLKILPWIKEIYIAGGEPFLVKEGKTLLEAVAASGHASNIILQYSSNLTYLPKGLFELWQKFKGVSLCVSLDGISTLNNYIRYPSKWEKLLENLYFLDENAESLNCNEVSINTTLQVYNLFQVPEIFMFFRNHFKFILPYPNLEPVMYRDFLSIQILPTELKTLAEQKLKEFTKTHFLKYGVLPPSQVREQIQKTIKFMWASDKSDLIPDFQRFTRFMDQSRGQDILTLVPELKSMMENENARKEELRL